MNGSALAIPRVCALAGATDLTDTAGRYSICSDRCFIAFP